MFDKEKVVRQPLGRPPKYRPEYAQQLIDFFETYGEDQVQPDGSVVPGRMPTLARFATMVGVTQITLRNWADAIDSFTDERMYPDFFTAYYQAAEYQAAAMTEGYTSGRFANPGFGVLIAKNLLAWRDKLDVESTVEANVKQTVEQTVHVSGLKEKLDALKGKDDSAV